MVMFVAQIPYFCSRIMDAIEKYRLLATLVRGIFAAYPSGIIDCHVSDPREKFQPQTVKKLMLEHYSEVNVVFNDTIFFPLAAINFDYDGALKVISDGVKRKLNTIELVKKICLTDEFYQAFKEEYKRNFGYLLEGRYSSIPNFLKEYTRCKGKIETVDGDRAIRLVVSCVMTAYARGIRGGGTGKASLHQPTLYRLLVDSMTALFHDKPLSLSQTDMQYGIGGMFLKACRNHHNLDVMTAEMDRTYAALVQEVGIISRDDTAN